MPICKVCKREHESIDYCEFCKREERWPKIRQQRIQEHFTKRIIQGLSTCEFKNPNFNLLASQYIHGKVGSGKTMYACALFIESIHNYHIFHRGNQTHIFMLMPELLHRIKRSYNSDPPETEFQIIEELTNVDFLLLDDLGAERSNEWALQILYLIINRRYEDLKTTIFTSNFKLKELENALGNDRIPSRIMAMCSDLDFGDKDLRCRKHDKPK